ncbi:MAG: PepSY-like domain-containing protein [Alistipes sp.]
MKKLLALLICFMIVGVSACTGEDRPIQLKQLPDVARQLLSLHFPDMKIAYLTEDDGVFSKSYEVGFINGDEIDFAKDGMWTEVNCKHSVVPHAIIPDLIRTYVAENHPTMSILKIERKKRGYEVQLHSGLELTFDQKFNVVKIEH